MVQQYIFRLPVFQDWHPYFNFEVTVLVRITYKAGQLDSAHASTQYRDARLINVKQTSEKWRNNNYRLPAF